LTGSVPNKIPLLPLSQSIWHPKKILGWQRYGL